VQRREFPAITRLAAIPPPDCAAARPGAGGAGAGRTPGDQRGTRVA